LYILRYNINVQQKNNIFIDKDVMNKNYNKKA